MVSFASVSHEKGTKISIRFPLKMVLINRVFDEVEESC